MIMARAPIISEQQTQNVASTAKHWAVYSVPKGGRDGHARTDPHVARRELEALHLFPWRKLIREAKIKGEYGRYQIQLALMTHSTS